MSAPHHDFDDQRHITAKAEIVLWRFEGRILDDALLSEMAEALNQEFASLLDGHRVKLAREGSNVKVELTESPTLVCYDAVKTALLAT